jgi:hypothetical protein
VSASEAEDLGELVHHQGLNRDPQGGAALDRELAHHDAPASASEFGEVLKSLNLLLQLLESRVM